MRVAAVRPPKPHDHASLRHSAGLKNGQVFSAQVGFANAARAAAGLAPLTFGQEEELLAVVRTSASSEGFAASAFDSRMRGITAPFKKFSL